LRLAALRLLCAREIRNPPSIAKAMEGSQSAIRNPQSAMENTHPLRAWQNRHHFPQFPHTFGD